MEALNDVAKIVHAFLTASGTDLQVAVGSRVWTPVVPKGFTNTQAGIVFHVESSPESARGALVSECVFKLYGGSSSLSDPGEIGRRLFGRLHLSSGQTDFGSLIHALCLSMSGVLSDPETGRPFRIDRYRIITQ